MPSLTRRRDPNFPQECWRIYYGDVVVGSISRNASAILALRPDGNGAAASILAAGRANDFDEARGDFETAWRVFLAKRTGADFQKWRDHRDWTERKYAAWDAGERVLA